LDGSVFYSTGVFSDTGVPGIMEQKTSILYK
jgi:hypothetical protein